ncbi:MAG: PAS domain-containing sensor histidine kinase [Acidimicrobiales bacterium]
MAGSDLIDKLAAADLLNAAPDAWVIVDAAGTVYLENALAKELFGYPSLTGMTVEDLLSPELGARHRRLRQEYLSDASPRPMGVGLELAAKKSDGTIFPVEISLSPVELAGEAFVIAAVRDVSAQVETRHELAHVREQAVVVEDRERLARDLHDTVIQSLFAVGLSLQSVGTHLEPESAGSRIQNAIDDLDAIIREIRGVIFDLGSISGAETEVRAEMERVVALQRRALGFDPDVSIIGDYSGVPPATARHLVHTLREALSNVAKHAEASRCSVEVELDESSIELVVVDDGMGPPGAPRPGGRGLDNLASRARQLGGTCSFGPSSTGGSELRWRVPMDAS